MFGSLCASPGRMRSCQCREESTVWQCMSKDCLVGSQSGVLPEHAGNAVGFVACSQLREAVRLVGGSAPM
jgi:hypothetical protein